MPQQRRNAAELREPSLSVRPAESMLDRVEISMDSTTTRTVATTPHVCAYVNQASAAIEQLRSSMARASASQFLCFDDKTAMNLDLYTDRLLLAPLIADDADLALEMYTDPEVLRYASGAMSEAEVLREMRDATKRGGDGSIGTWCIANRRTGEKLGITYLLPLPVEEGCTNYSLVMMGQMPDAEIELGYFLKRSAWGRGYATEVCKRMLHFAFQEASLSGLVASVHDENVASMRVLEKSGLTDRSRTLCYGEDNLVYRISRDEWIEIQRSTDSEAPTLRSASGW